MSGGSYNYLYNQHDIHGHVDLGDLKDMRDRLAELAPDSAAAKATARLYDALSAPIDKALTEVWHDIEWADSSDYSQDQAMSAIRDYEAVASQRAEEFAAERDRLARAIHRRVNSSRIGATVPYSVGDAERAAAAVVLEGWTPPEGYAETED